MSESKICTICNEVKSLTDYYSQKKFSKKRGEYIYYNPECKECTRKKALFWQKDNRERWNESVAQRFKNTEKHRIAKRLRTKKRQSDGYLREYQQNNKDKIREYNKQHRIHNISNEEWQECKNYFDNSCAYCGISEEKHIQLFRQQLHKEHVDHEGSNGLSNCIPSCRKCNSQKWKFTLEEWYNENNQDYSVTRLNKINQWLNNDYMKYLNSR